MYVFLNTDQLGSLRKSGKVRFPGGVENGKCPYAVVELRGEEQGTVAWNNT